MLTLRLAGQIIKDDVLEGGAFTLPDGSFVSPAYSGWVNPDGYDLVTTPEPPPAALTTADVDAERDRRMFSMFMFQGRPFGADRDSLQRISGAATLAGLAMGAGAEAGNLYWHGGELPFAWIAGDNDIVEMDAPTAFAFGQAAAAHVTAHIFAARAIKDLAPNIPADFADNANWP